LAKFLGAHVLWVERSDFREESVGFEVIHQKKPEAANV
jgi:hypothetical protein